MTVGLCGAAVVVVAVAAWSLLCSPTKIAFLNYQVINLGEISKANDNPFVKIGELTVGELDHLNGYDMLFINGMGLRMVESQRELLLKAAEKGMPILTTAATNPPNDICSVDPLVADSLRRYIVNGGRRNYRSLLNLVRKHIDKKMFFVEDPEPSVQASDDMLYHVDPENQEAEPLGFNSVAEYNMFLKKNKLWREHAPRIIVTGQMGEPTDLIRRLEETGNVVYPVRSMRRLVKCLHIDTIHPSAVINMAHGRMGDYMVDYLAKQNIPLFAPLNVNRLDAEWETDEMGMNGGFLSQSVVTPEIDGAIRPFVLFGHYEDEDGLQHVRAIPERLEMFVATVNNYVKLKDKPNAEKRIAIYYYKGPGQNALTASGMEVVPSLYNFLRRLEKEGYHVGKLPADSKELGRLIQSQGAVFNLYAEGAFDEFIKTGHPELVSKDEYETWVKARIRPEQYAEVVAANGEFPGSYMTTSDGKLGVARLQFGNVVLLPQNTAAVGDNSFQIVHGAKTPPPHTYIASYLWVRYGFKADAMIHFGTHGSLEYTPGKQVALCSKDWPDRLVGDLPHFYIYTIGNVGEAMIAKRRSYAGIQSYLTPPFKESNVRGIYCELHEAIKDYNNLLEEAGTQREAVDKASLKVKQLTVKLGIHRELALDSMMAQPYDAKQVARVENFAEELAAEKITGRLYTMGVPYDEEDIVSTIYAMSVDPVAYSMFVLDKQRGVTDIDIESHRSRFNRYYVSPAKELVGRILAQPHSVSDETVCRMAGISAQELDEAREITASQHRPDMLSMMMAAAEEIELSESMPHEPAGGDATGVSDAKKRQMKKFSGWVPMEKALEMAKKMGADSSALEKMRKAMTDGKEGTSADRPHATHGGPAHENEGMPRSPMAAMMEKKTYTKEQMDRATAIMEVERTIKNVGAYRDFLLESPEREMESMLNALDGGYTLPSSGGDPIANPASLPTGRNLYAINAECTPTESAWEKGVRLARHTIDLYKARHNDSIPRKVSYTLWSSEFIETEGATIAQVLYMLGVEPVRDAFGRVTDLRLIPSEELGRPRIDVVVQTSGQLRDLAASRLLLVSRAVEMAAAAKDDRFENQVAAGVVESERILTEKGMSPKEARKMAFYRVFGGINGNYGTGITGMVEAGDRWENESEIAATYLNNMGAYYGSEEDWENFRQYVFEAALSRTDAVVQPRQSNTWGALSLDHVFEFMGGMNLAVRNVTGKEPEAFLSDYRNRNHVRMQEVKEAIGVESRTTLFNPTFIKDKMKGEASSANELAEIVRNTYGWNVMKPDAIDDEMWNEIYDVYVKDKFGLGVKEYFEGQNPAALQEMTAVMMETARKGMWKANESQLQDIAGLHAELVNKYRPACSGFVCDNARLKDFIASKADRQAARRYLDNIAKVRESMAGNGDKGVVLKKEEMNRNSGETKTNTVSNTVVAVVVVMALVAVVFFIRRKQRKE